MQESGKISVLMGIYNCANTLPEAIDSILNQTYTNWELILCDDASTDNTYQVALKYQQKYPDKIILLKNEKNLTLAPTLNKCLAMASGEFIARMDGDDLCEPERFDLEIEILKQNSDFSIVSCSMDLFDSNGTFRTVQHKEYPTQKDLIHGPQFCHAGCMVRTDAIRAVNGYSESPKRKRVEDFDLWVRMYHAGYRGVNILKTLYHMRDDINALKRRSFDNRLNGCRVTYYACKYAKMPFYVTFYLLTRQLAKYFVPQFIYRYIHSKKK